MKPVIRMPLDEILQGGGPVELELGAGGRPVPGRINIDRRDLPQVQIVADLNQGLPFLPDDSVDAIHSKSVLEHIDDLDLLMREIWRVLKPGGKKHLFVPHFSNPYYYSDTSHRRFFGLYSFEYFGGGSGKFTRKVPSFYHDFGFVTEEIRLVFGSPWRGRNFVKRVVERVVNAHPASMEFYEENLCYLIPCYGIEAVLAPEK